MDDIAKSMQDAGRQMGNPLPLGNGPITQQAAINSPNTHGTLTYQADQLIRDLEQRLDFLKKWRASL